MANQIPRLDDDPERTYAIGIDVYENGYYLSFTPPDGPTRKLVFNDRSSMADFIFTEIEEYKENS